MSTGGSREGDGGTRPQEDAPRPPGALACTSHSTRGRGATMDMPAPHAAVVAQASDAERAGLALLAARAMHDNPMHVAAIGQDLDRRVEVMRSAYVPMLAGREVLAARVGERVVGVAAHTPSPGCRTGATGLLRFVPAAVRAGAATPRLLRWLAASGRRAPHEP